MVEGRQRKVALAREWMQLGMFFEVLRGGCGLTPDAPAPWQRGCWRRRFPHTPP